MRTHIQFRGRAAAGATLLGLLSSCGDLPMSPHGVEAPDVPFSAAISSLAVAVEDAVVRILPSFSDDPAARELGRALTRLLRAIDAVDPAATGIALTEARASLAALAPGTSPPDVDVIQLTLDQVEAAQPLR